VQAADAIVMLEGDGLNRLPYAADLFHRGLAPRICFSGGADNKPYGSYLYANFIESLKEYNLDPSYFVLEEKSQHTQDQAVEVIKLAISSGWKKLILVASHYHQYRAYLTFVQEILNTSPHIILMNAPARNLPWFTESGWGIRNELLLQEFIKIEKYITTGHCSTYEDAIKYQLWKEQALRK